MVTPRKPNETDADYVARIGDDVRRWEIALSEADRAIAYLIMAAPFGRRGGFDLDGMEGWQRRSAMVRGIEMAREIADLALSHAVSITRHDVTRVPIELRDQLMIMRVFAFRHRDTMIPIPQAEIDAVCEAAEVIVAELKPAIEALRKSPPGS